jgi:hypothetical protein
MNRMISSPAKVKEIAQKAVSVEKGPSSRRPMIFGALLFVATLAVLAAGGWGLLASLGSPAPPAAVGDTVEVSGGLLSVDDVTLENMAPMQMKKFGASGMNMQATGIDMAPEGFRRFTVDVSLAAQEGGNFSYSAKDFKVSGEGMKEAGPIRHQLKAGTLAPGSATSGALVFQAPEEAKNLMLSFGDGRQPVALDLEPGEGSHKHGGAQSENEGHGH